MSLLKTDRPEQTVIAVGIHESDAAGLIVARSAGAATDFRETLHASSATGLPCYWEQCQPFT